MQPRDHVLVEPSCGGNLKVERLNFIPSLRLCCLHLPTSVSVKYRRISFFLLQINMDIRRANSTTPLNNQGETATILFLAENLL